MINSSIAFTSKPATVEQKRQKNDLDKQFVTKIMVSSGGGAAVGGLLSLSTNPLGGALSGANLSAGTTAIIDAFERRGNRNPLDKSMENTIKSALLALPAIALLSVGIAKATSPIAKVALGFMALTTPVTVIGIAANIQAGIKALSLGLSSQNK